jgi:hypothetical protein
MSARINVVYAEYESGEPPFVWVGGQLLPHAEKQRAHAIIRRFQDGTEVHADGGVAVLLKQAEGADLLIQTTAGFRHRSCGPQRVVVVLCDIDETSTEWGSEVAQVAQILSGAGIDTDPPRLGRVIATATTTFGARSRRKRRVVEALSVGAAAAALGGATWSGKGGATGLVTRVAASGFVGIVAGAGAEALGVAQRRARDALKLKTIEQGRPPANVDNTQKRGQ